MMVTGIGFNPTLKIKLSPKTTLDFHMNMPTMKGLLTEVFQRQMVCQLKHLKKLHLATLTSMSKRLKADIAKGILSHEFSDTMKGNITVHYSDYEKMYQNLYASGYDARQIL